MLGGDVVHNPLAVFEAAYGISDDSFMALDARLAANDLLSLFDGRRSHGADRLLNDAASFFRAGSLLWLVT